MHEAGYTPTIFLSAATVGQDMGELKKLLANELTICLFFEGSIWDLDSSHEAVISQDELLLRPFEKRVNFLGDDRMTVFECTFKIRELNPDEPLRFSVTQTPGGRRFPFKIDPEALGPEEFF